MFHRLVILFLLTAAGSSLIAQLTQINYPLNRWSQINMDRYLNEKDSIPADFVKPNITYRKELYDLPGFKKDTGKYYFGATQKLFGENLIIIDKPALFVTIDPIIDQQIGWEFRDSTAYADTAKFVTNTRGFFIRGSIGKKVSFQTHFAENILFYPFYLRQYVEETNVAPGMGRTKTYQVNGYDAGVAGGFVSYQALPTWNIQFGHGKHFLGEGYRSIILSDNAPNYPFFRSTISLLKGRLSYTTLLASLQNDLRLPFGSSTESLYSRKAMSINSISYSPIKNIRLGFSEGVMWQTFVEDEGNLDFDPFWLNPAILLNATKSEWNGPNNLFMAFDLTVKPTSEITVYYQHMIDDPNSRRNSNLLGVKTSEFGVSNLWARLEFSQSNRFTYTNANVLQNISHFGQELAHPIGAGFNEFIAQFSYKFRRIFIDGNLQLLKTSYFTEQELGVDIFASEGVIDPNDLIDAEVNSQYFRIGYFFNPFNNFMAFVSIQNRNKFIEELGVEKNLLFSIGFKNELFNRYYDF